MANLRVCPQCGGVMGVADSREQGDRIWRRRRCTTCDFRHSTIEMLYDDFEDYNRKEVIVDNILRQVQYATEALKQGAFEKK